MRLHVYVRAGREWSPVQGEFSDAATAEHVAARWLFHVRGACEAQVHDVDRGRIVAHIWRESPRDEWLTERWVHS